MLVRSYNQGKYGYWQDLFFNLRFSNQYKISCLGGGISAPQNLRGMFSFLLSFSTICSQPHLWQPPREMQNRCENC